VPKERISSSSWESISEKLRDALNAGTYGKWFGTASALEEDDEKLIVGVPNEFTKSWIESHFGSLLDAAAAEHDLVVELRVAVAEAKAEAAATSERPRIETPDIVTSHAAPAPSRLGSKLSPRYTFDLFVIGPSNRFAHAAALAVAESPAQAYNPLFIHGSTGLGKTHLLQAVGQYVIEQHPELNVRYVTTETLMNEFVDALREKKVVGFKHRYRNADILLVDDIQFLEGKENLQEEFFHTFNSLYEAGKQIVIACDRAPKKLATLEERLRTRFEWGLTTDVQPPDLETRIAILRKRVITDHLSVSDPEVLTFIADRVTTNIRELEGALTRVLAYASLTGRAITVEVAQEVLKDLFPEGAGRPITIEQIQSAVCDAFRVNLAELKGDKRTQDIVYPRHVAMYLARELTDVSLPKIGAKFGGRDHSSVIHAKDKISKLLVEDRDAFNLVQDLTARIKQSR
jgi:chromosomal replication initiator protein